jgi:hypothetical protein
MLIQTLLGLSKKQTKKSGYATGVMIMLLNQLLDMPHLSGGWIILAKEKCSLTRM